MKQFILIGLILMMQKVNAQVDLQGLLRQVQSKTASYQAPSLLQVQQCQQLFYRSFSDGYSEKLAQAWSEQGFQFSQQDGLLIIQETAIQGHGFYVIQPQFNKQTPLLTLQAPHSFKDLHTGKIAVSLFQTGKFYAAAWNSVPRYGQQDQDLAHLDHSVFQAFGLALIQAHADSWIIQLHGFNQKKRHSHAGQQADMILSATENYSPDWLKNLAKTFKSHWQNQNIQIYPKTVQELGGTKNSNANGFKRRGFKQFLHVEMSKPLRDLLRQQPSYQQTFSQVLQQLP